MNFVDDAPGADDECVLHWKESASADDFRSGSGVAISMELARIMATRRPAATIMFAAVAGEEQGLYGKRMAFMAPS